MLPRRPFLQLNDMSLSAALSGASRFAWAQRYPTRPLRMIVGDAPGGAPHIVSRVMAEWLSERLGQRRVSERKPARCGRYSVAMQGVSKAQSERPTLALVSTSAATSATLYQNLDYDLIRDIAPVAGSVRSPLVMVINAAFPAKTVPEFIAYAKANPSKINMASAGNGSGTARGPRLIQHDVGQQL